MKSTTCWKKLKKQADSSASSGEQSVASEGESFQIHQEMEEVEDNVSRERIDSTLNVLEQSPLVLHSKPKRYRQTLVKRKLKAVTQNLNESFSAVIRTNQLDISIDDHPSTSYHASSDSSQLMSDLNTQFEKATTRSYKIQISTLKPASWTIEETTEFFQCIQHAVS